MQEQILVTEKAGLLARPNEWQPGRQAGITFVKYENLHFGMERQVQAACPTQLRFDILCSQVFFQPLHYHLGIFLDKVLHGF
jgi:hypothetical protein